MINLYYKDIKLGELDYQNGFYYYSSSSFEDLAFEKYVGLGAYNLRNSKNLKNKELFAFFKNEFINPTLKRPDILKKIGENSKNDYEILEKLCKLNFDKFNFWLSIN